MITESGPSRWASEDDTPTQVFGPIVIPDDTEFGSSLIGDESAEANGVDEAREEHGLAALLTGDAPNLAPPRTRERRTVKITAALGVVMLAVIGVATYQVVTHARKTSPAQSLSAHNAARNVAARSAVATASASPVQKASPTHSATPSPSAATHVPSSAPVQTLRLVAATALGPNGRTGDDPQGAQNALTGKGPGWQTDWYLTPRFGGLQTGTGLLLDLGSAKTISSASVMLGSEPGAEFQLRAGDVQSASLPVVATSSGRGGLVQLTLAHPVQARYLVIWFTSLPPDGAGHYQVKVYQVTVRGHA